MSNYQLAFSHIKNEDEMHELAQSMVLEPTKLFSNENIMTINDVRRAVRGIKNVLEEWVKVDNEDVSGAASYEMTLLNSWLEGSAIGDIGGMGLAQDYVADLYSDLAKRTAETYDELDNIQDVISSWGETNPNREKKDALDAIYDNQEVSEYGRRTAKLIFELQDLRRTICVYEMAHQFFNTATCAAIGCKKMPYGLVSLAKVDSYRLGCFCGCKTEQSIKKGVIRCSIVIQNIDNSIEALKHLLYGMKYEHPGCSNGVLTPMYL